MRFVSFLITTLLLAPGCVLDDSRLRAELNFRASVTLVSDGIDAHSVGVLINKQDPDSVAIGNYYQQKRNIPPANLIEVSFNPNTKVLSEADFAKVQAQINQQVTSEIQVYALTWTNTYRVSCMSITSAIALGFNEAYCGFSGGGNGCHDTKLVPYYESNSSKPFDDYGIRPAMALAGTSVENVKALIDRAISADNSFPGGAGYLIRTTDESRNRRYRDLAAVKQRWAGPDNINMDYIYSTTTATNHIENKPDVLFYFTGLANVPGVSSNTFIPGSVADHLTSYGGIPGPSGQMSAIRWLEAGAAGSYGTVVEPCNILEKFPRVSTFLKNYTQGETLIEAYWKSVFQPGEGIFVGDPLTRPWGHHISYDPKTRMLEITTARLKAGTDYDLLQAPKANGPYEVIMDAIEGDSKVQKINLRLTGEGRFFRFRETQ